MSADHLDPLAAWLLAGLNKDLLTKKIRCLTLATLCSSSSKNEVSYAEIAAAIEVDEKDVEVWVIDGQSQLSSLVAPT